MLPRTSPLMTCWLFTPASGPRGPLLQDLELAVLHDLDRGRMAPVAVRQEGELAERGREVLHLAEAVLHVGAAVLAALELDRVGDDLHAHVRLGRELVGRDAPRLHEG